MSATPLILSLETATLGGSVFLSRGNVELAAHLGDPTISQSASLLSDINNVLAEGGASLREVDLFACASGPGSFTGLRIGIATLKALAASLQRPCVGIPTLQAVSHAAGPSVATVSLLPAGRGEVFAQLFSVSQDSVVTELDSAAHLSPARLVERYSGLPDLCWAGSGAHVQREFLNSSAHQQGIRFEEQTSFVESASTASSEKVWRLAAKETNLARHVTALALQVFHAGNIQPPQSLSAIYVRPSDAELNEQCR